MPVVLKLAAQGDVHRVRLEEAPTFSSLDILLRELYPKTGASGGCRLARYTDEDGDACLLTPATFADFLETARTTGGGVCPVLRLEILPLPVCAPAPEHAGDVAAAGCLPRVEDGSCAASPAAAWLCLDGAHDCGASDCSWVCAGGSPGGGSSGQCSARGLPTEGGTAGPHSEAGSNERTQDESGPSEASFESLAFNPTELHAEDLDSSAGARSEQELLGEASLLLDTALGSGIAGLQAVASAETEEAAEGQASEEVLPSLLQPDVAAAEPPLARIPVEAAAVADSAMPLPAMATATVSPSSPIESTASAQVNMLASTPSQGLAQAVPAQGSAGLALEPAPVPDLAVKPVPTPVPVATKVLSATSAIEYADAMAVMIPQGAECHGQVGALDLELGLGSAAPLPCGGPTPPHASQEELPAAAAPPPTAAAVGHHRPRAAAMRRQKATEAVDVEVEGVAKGRQRSSAMAASQPGSPVWLGAGLEKMVHMGHICDGCEACPLPGPRFTCRTCSDYDLCWTCYMWKDKLPMPHDPSHRFQQVLWSEEVVPACPGGCGFGVTACSGHPTHCCSRCADAPGQHTDACQKANAHDEDELDP